MRISKTIFTLLLCLLLLPLGGCSRHSTGDSPAPLRIVTEIDINFVDGPLHCRRHYNQDAKMSQVLAYLRQIDPYGKPEEDPALADGSLFQISLTYSDGSKKVYEQKADRYLRLDDGPWETIDPSKAEALGQLLGTLPSDLEEI